MNLYMSNLREINVRLLTDVVKGTAPGVKSIESMKRFNGDRGIQPQLIQRDLALSSNRHCDRVGEKPLFRAQVKRPRLGKRVRRYPI